MMSHGTSKNIYLERRDDILFYYKRIVSHLLYNPLLLKYVDDDDISTKREGDAIIAIKKLCQLVEGQIPPKMFLDYCSVNDLEIGEFEVNSYYNIIESEIIGNDPKTIEYNFNCLCEELSKRKKDTYTEKLLNMSLNSLRAGNRDECIEISKSIKFYTNDKLDSTLSIMMNSVSSSDGFPSGFAQIDDAGGLLKGNIMAIGGDSGAMKTKIVMWMMLSILIANPKYKIALFEKEMPVQDIGLRLNTIFLRKENTDLLRRILRKEHGSIIKDIDGITEEELSIINRFIVIPNTKFKSCTDMYRIVENEGIDCWALDFLTMLEGDKTSKKGDFTEFINDQMLRIKDMVANTNTFGLIISQLNKNTVENRLNKIPKKDDFEWGNKLYQMSAYAYSIFYPHKYYLDDDRIKSYFYLYDLKERNDEVSYNRIIPLISQPGKSTFLIPSPEQKHIMLEWIKEYINGSLMKVKNG